MPRKSREAGASRASVNDADILAKLRAFRTRVAHLETEKERLTREYPDQWAALHSGDVVVARSLEDLLRKLEGQGVPTSEAAIQFLDSNPTVMILCQP